MRSRSRIEFGEEGGRREDRQLSFESEKVLVAGSDHGLRVFGERDHVVVSRVG
jgi:hypothetical protein